MTTTATTQTSKKQPTVEAVWVTESPTRFRLPDKFSYDSTKQPTKKLLLQPTSPKIKRLKPGRKRTRPVNGNIHSETTNSSALGNRKGVFFSNPEQCTHTNPKTGERCKRKINFSISENYCTQHFNVRKEEDEE